MHGEALDRRGVVRIPSRVVFCLGVVAVGGPSLVRREEGSFQSSEALMGKRGRLSGGACAIVKQRETRAP